MFRIIWEYQILNAVILSSSNELDDRKEREIELYNFNPYSANHPRQWKMIINETVEVTNNVGKFNHSWYIFEWRFTGIRSLDDCGDMFFDKTGDLDGYWVRVGSSDGKAFSQEGKAERGRWATSELIVMETVAQSLRFNIVEVTPTIIEDSYGERQLELNRYPGTWADVAEGRSDIIPLTMNPSVPPGLAVTYPHDRTGICILSPIVGNQPQWMSLAAAKYIWMGLGVAVLFSAVILYLQNRSEGVVSAFLEAERLVVGTSVIRMSAEVKHRMIMGSMFLTFLVIDGAIKGRFISILTVVKPYPNIDTLEQLDELDMDWFGPDAFAIYFKTPEQKARLRHEKRLEPCIEAIEQGSRRPVCFAECRMMTFRATNLAVVHKALEPFSTGLAVYITSPHWPLKDRYSYQLQILVESGIYKKWKMDPARDAEVESWERTRAWERGETNRPTKLNDLLPAFMLLFLGLSIALIVFAWEIKCWKYLFCFRN